MVKGKRYGLTSTECSVKSADFYRFHRHIENGATTMQRNRSAHATWACLCLFRPQKRIKLICFKTGTIVPLKDGY